MHPQITSAIVEDTQPLKSGSLLIRDTKLIGFGLRISPLGIRTFFRRQTRRHPSPSYAPDRGPYGELAM